MLLTFGTFLGGLGLFLLAVTMITDGVKIAAGGALRGILARSTRTAWRGILSGAFLTAMVQSSSAVTVATIGFVNAGLLGIAQALGIVLGATIGTTMTGWLVAAVGFQFKIASFALPMIGAGMIIRLVGPSRRIGAVGEVLAGFGLFFIGLDFLREAFEGVVALIDIADLSPEGLQGVLLFVAIGGMLTVLTNSSSAAMAITLSALSGGLIAFPAAAAAAIGATIGTTSTSALAAIGATPNARRVAAGHVLINSFNALVGLLLLPAVTWALTHDSLAGLTPVIALAAFHTIFNVSGMVIQRPFMGRLATFLKKRFISPVEELSRPQYLDSNIIASPALALDAFLLELKRMAQLSRNQVRAALATGGKSGRVLRQQHDGIRRLVVRVEGFVTTLETERLHRDVASRLPMVLRISNYIDEVVALAQENVEGARDVEFLMSTAVGPEIEVYQKASLRLIESCDPELGLTAEQLESEYQQLRTLWRNLKTTLLDAGVRRLVPVSRLNPAIENLRIMLRVAERSTRIAVRLAEISRQTPAAGENDSTSEVSSTGLGNKDCNSSVDRTGFSDELKDLSEH